MYEFKNTEYGEVLKKIYDDLFINENCTITEKDGHTIIKPTEKEKKFYDINKLLTDRDRTYRLRMEVR